MSATVKAADDAARAGVGMAPRRGLPGWALGLIIFSLLCLTRLVTGQPDITSTGTLDAALLLAVPIGLAGLGGMFSERSSIVNIGLEGMMVLGTWFGAFVGYQAGPWLGMLAAGFGGVLGAILHAVATIHFGVNHIVSGTAINILGPGVASYLSTQLYDGVVGAGPNQSPSVRSFPEVSLPWGGFLGDIESKQIFLLSDAAGILRGLTTNVSAIILVAAALFVISYYVLWKTAFGLRLRSCGENPYAAASLGVPVRKFMYAGVLISGFLAGVGGMALVEAASRYQEGQTAGRGFIGLAAMIFGNYRPAGIAQAALLFGYADALQLRANSAVHGLLLFVGLLGLLFAALALMKGSRTGAIWAGAGGVLFLLLYTLTDSVPAEFVGFTPHLITLLVLAVSAGSLRMPAFTGQTYDPAGH